MSGLSLGLALGLSLLALALHMLSIALARALRTYSRSRLEDLCRRRGHPNRTDTVARLDERTERAADGLAVLTGLALAALMGAIVAQSAPVLTAQAIVAIALALGALGHVAAGIIGRVYAESVIDRLWPLTASLRGLMAPLTATARAVEAIAYHRLRRSQPTPRPQSVEVELTSSDELASEHFEANLPDPTRKLLENAISLAHRDVSEIMIPRAAMLTLPASVAPLDAARAFTESGYSRIPLYGEHRDDIVGILYAKDLFPALVSADDRSTVVPRKLGRPALFVPETKDATELLQEFRSRHVQIAIVVDEFGAVVGLITLENLLEELVGPIEDEHDEPEVADEVVDLGDRSYEVDATLDLEELNSRLELDLPTDEDYSTVGGLAFHALGRVPEPGASFRLDGIEFTVLEVAEHTIRRLRLDLQPAEAATEPER